MNKVGKEAPTLSLSRASRDRGPRTISSIIARKPPPVTITPRPGSSAKGTRSQANYAFKPCLTDGARLQFVQIPRCRRALNPTLMHHPGQGRPGLSAAQTAPGRLQAGAYRTDESIPDPQQAN